MITANRAYELSWQLTLDLPESSVKTTQLRYILVQGRTQYFCKFSGMYWELFHLESRGRLRRTESAINREGQDKKPLGLKSLLKPLMPIYKVRFLLATVVRDSRGAASVRHDFTSNRGV